MRSTGRSELLLAASVAPRRSALHTESSRAPAHPPARPLVATTRMQTEPRQSFEPPQAMESPTPLANRTNAADTPVDAKNILKTRLRPKPPTVLSPLAKDYEPMNDHDDDSNDEDFVYDAAKEGKLKGASEQWTRGKRPIEDDAAVDAVLDAIDDLQRPEEVDADEMLEDACGAMSCAPAPPEELQEMEALEDASAEIESIEDAADAELLEDASAAVAAPGGPFEDVVVQPPAPPSPPRTRYPLLTRFMECIGSRL